MVRKKLKDALLHVLSADDLELLVRGYDVLGDVAIVIIPKELEHHEAVIADAILIAGSNIRVVAKRVGNYSGEFRTISLKKIGGQGGLATLHREFGIRLYVDPEKVYFSPRSGNERRRIAAQVLPGERVLVMFSGVSPLPLMIGLHSEAIEIIGVEKNPEAHLLALKNLKANRKIKNITLLNGDVCDLVSDSLGSFERIVMPLPHQAANYLELALGALKSNGWLHYYDFLLIEEFGCAEESVRKACSQLGREVVHSTVHKCGHISPRKYRICVDANIS